MDEYRGVVPSIFQLVYTDVYMGALLKPCIRGIIHFLKLTVRPCKSIVGRLLCWGELLVLGRVIHHSSKPWQPRGFWSLCCFCASCGLGRNMPSWINSQVCRGQSRVGLLRTWVSRQKTHHNPIFLIWLHGMMIQNPLNKGPISWGVVGNNGSTLQLPMMPFVFEWPFFRLWWLRPCAARNQAVGDATRCVWSSTAEVWLRQGRGGKGHGMGPTIQWSNWWLDEQGYLGMLPDFQDASTKIIVFVGSVFPTLNLHIFHMRIQIRSHQFRYSISGS